jgi:excisionase family DNA binding protein
MKPKADLAASVAARLLNRAKQTGDEHQYLLTSYCLERFHRSQTSVTQAATALGISRAAVRKAISQRRLAAQRYGNVVLVSREAVQQYKQERAGGRRKPRRSRARGSEGRPSGSPLAARRR